MKGLIMIGLALLLATTAYAVYDKCEVQEVTDVVEEVESKDNKEPEVIGKRLVLLCKRTKLVKGDEVKVKVVKKVEGC